MWHWITFIIWGAIIGLIARMLYPGRNNPSGFILTAALGIVGSFLATWIGQEIGHYNVGEGATGAGWITSTIGAVVVLFIWNRLVAAGVIPDPGGGQRG